MSTHETYQTLDFSSSWIEINSYLPLNFSSNGASAILFPKGNVLRFSLSQHVSTRGNGNISVRNLDHACWPQSLLSSISAQLIAEEEADR